MAKAALIYPSMYEQLSILNDSERAKAYDVLVEYQLYNVVPDMDSLPPTVKLIVIGALPVLDSAANRYKASVENGKKGGAPAGNQNAKKSTKKQPETQPENNHDIDTDNDSYSDKEIDSYSDEDTYFERESKGETSSAAILVSAVHTASDLDSLQKEWEKARDRNDLPEMVRIQTIMKRGY